MKIKFPLFILLISLVICSCSNPDNNKTNEFKYCGLSDVKEHDVDLTDNRGLKFYLPVDFYRCDRLDIESLEGAFIGDIIKSEYFKSDKRPFHVRIYFSDFLHETHYLNVDLIGHFKSYYQDYLNSVPSFYKKCNLTDTVTYISRINPDSEHNSIYCYFECLTQKNDTSYRVVLEGGDYTDNFNLEEMRQILESIKFY